MQLLERAFRWQNNKTSNFDSSLISLKSNQERPTPSSSPTRRNSITRRSISPDSPSSSRCVAHLIASLPGEEQDIFSDTRTQHEPRHLVQVHWNFMYNFNSCRHYFFHPRIFLIYFLRQQIGVFPANNNPFSTFLPEAKGKLGRGIRSLASPRSDGWTTTTRISGFVKITISRGESKEKERGESFIALHVSIPWNNLLANIFVQICYLRWRCLNSEARDIHKRPISRRYRRLHFASITTLSCDRRRKVEGKIKRAGGESGLGIVRY